MINEIGKHNDVPDEKFVYKELMMGINIEKEHTDDEEEARSIAKDHLSEFPDYYSRLIAMERKAKEDNFKEGKNISTPFSDTLERIQHNEQLIRTGESIDISFNENKFINMFSSFRNKMSESDKKESVSIYKRLKNMYDMIDTEDQFKTFITYISNNADSKKDEESEYMIDAATRLYKVLRKDRYPKDLCTQVACMYYYKSFIKRWLNIKQSKKETDEDIAYYRVNARIKHAEEVGLLTQYFSLTLLVCTAISLGGAIFTDTKYAQWKVPVTIGVIGLLVIDLLIANRKFNKRIASEEEKMSEAIGIEYDPTFKLIKDKCFSILKKVPDNILDLSSKFAKRISVKTDYNNPSDSFRSIYNGLDGIDGETEDSETRETRINASVRVYFALLKNGVPKNVAYDYAKAYLLAHVVQRLINQKQSKEETDADIEKFLQNPRQVYKYYAQIVLNKVVAYFLTSTAMDKTGIEEGNPTRFWVWTSAVLFFLADNFYARKILKRAIDDKTGSLAQATLT